MIVCTIKDQPTKKFLLDTASHVLNHPTGNYWKTETGNFVKEVGGEWFEVPAQVVKDNILLLPHDVAKDSFPEWFIDNPETI